MKITKNHIVILAYAVVIMVMESSILFHIRLPFYQDWSWPLFNTKYYFWDQLIQFDGGLMSVFVKNETLLFVVLGYIIQSSLILFKIIIFLTQLFASYSFYRLSKRFTTDIISFIAGLAYAFTPYFFIRVIMGFLFSLVAYAILPFFINLYFFNEKKKFYYYLFLGFLLSLIFAQIQAGLLVLMLLLLHLIISLFIGKATLALKNLILLVCSFITVNLPWIILVFTNKNSLNVPEGGAVSTLGRMAAMPHSFKSIFMTSDFEFTSGFFLTLASNKLYMLGWLIVWFIAFCAIFSKKNRALIITLVVASASVLTLIKGPTGIFGNFYMFIYNHFPQIMIFRDTDHFIFLLAFTLCFCFAIGLDLIWKKIDTIKTKNLLKTGVKTIFAGSVIFIITPYLTFDYAGFSPVRQIPSSYNDLNNYFENNKNVCHKIFYPPGLDFIYFKGDTASGASNSDTVASSLGINYVHGGTSILNTPSSEMFYQNELISRFYENNDSGEFVSLIKEDGVDCVVARQDIDTKYDQAMNLKFEKDPFILKKWNQNDWHAMLKTKQGLVEETSFGNNIFIYKIDNEFETSSNKDREEREQAVGKSVAKQFSTFYSLPLTDWANVNSFYKNGWSRGRYDFWRKHLFAQLRKDFIYTDKQGDILTGKIDKKGSYELWARHLTGGTSGSYQLTINAKQFTVAKDSGDEKFVWEKLGDIALNGQTNVELKNINGENAIADLVLVNK